MYSMPIQIVHLDIKLNMFKTKLLTSPTPASPVFPYLSNFILPITHTKILMLVLDSSLSLIL